MSNPTFTNLLYSVQDRIGTITLNRPEKLNAMSKSLLDELELAFSAAKADDEVSVVLLKGAGRSFCAGYDLAPDDWILTQYGADFEGPVDAVIDRDDVTEILERWLRLWKFPKPIKLGPRASGWLESEINAWISERIAESRSADLTATT